MKSNPYKRKKYHHEIIDRNSRNSIHKSPPPKRLFGAFTRKFSARPRLHRRWQWFHRKDLYIDSVYQKKTPAWLVPLLLVLTITLVAFWLGPFVLDTITSTFFSQTATPPGQNLIYDSKDYAVVKTQVADLFETPDLKSARKTQVLYNQLVHILDRSTYGFYQVELDDGTTGYVMSKDVTSYTASVEPSLYDYTIVVVSTSKKIMTHSSNGSTIMEAMMGTTLYSDYQGDGVYKVALPDHTEGWISASGVLKIDTGEKILVSNAKSFYTTVLSFNNTTYIGKGITKNGASSEGIAYISAKINGIALPRDKEGQSTAGVEVPLQYAEETGLLIYDNLKEGDLIFFKSALDSTKAGEMGIIVGYGQVLMSRKSKAAVKIVDLAGTSALAESVLSVRRIF